jgi:hypothetical protein
MTGATRGAGTPTLSEHLSSPSVFSGVRVTQSLVLYVCFVDCCSSFCTFSYGHCVVLQYLRPPFWKVHYTPHVIRHTCKTDQVITPPGDMTCCILNLWQRTHGKCSLCNEWWHSFMNERLNHLVLLYKCSCIRIMSINAYNKTIIDFHFD